MFRSLKEPNYRRWFSGALISNTGTWMQRTAQDWIVLTELTDSDASALGITMALQLGPQLFLAPLAGTLADRIDRRTLLLATQAAQAVLALVLFALVVSGSVVLWHVYLLALLLGLVSAIDAPTRQAFVSDLVGDALLPNAVGLNSASFNGARMVGPAIAGVLTASIGAAPVFLISGLGFIATITALLRLDRSTLHTQPRGPRQKGMLRQGLRYVRGRGDIVIVLVVIGIVGTFGMNFSIYTATMSHTEFGRDADGFGLVTSLMAVGSLTGALLAAKRERPRLRMVFASAGLFGAACIASAAMPGYWTFAISLILVGLSALTMMTAANAYVQTATAAPMRGRVMALYTATIMGGTPIGAPFAGWLANEFGPRVSLAAGGVSGLVALAVGIIWMMRTKNMRVHTQANSRFKLRLDYDGKTDGR